MNAADVVTVVGGVLIAFGVFYLGAHTGTMYGGVESAVESAYDAGYHAGRSSCAAIEAACTNGSISEECYVAVKEARH